MTWDHLTEDNIADLDRNTVLWNHFIQKNLDRNISTLQTAFYREIETGTATDSARILGELARLREIKKQWLATVQLEKDWSQD